MSKTVDERVVEMRFDNQQFEKNVETSMSTLDKLKRSLNLTGASKGLENLNTAAKNVNMSGLSSAVETVHAKFSALEVVGVTALANITNSAINAGKRMMSALTMDPIMSGFQEYETQINAVQTILANTQSKGTTLDDVNNALDELNKYADKTIYNFTEMTRNIGTFTAAGVDLDTSVNAIQGIANLAAVSGSASQQASTVMYQLSQALAAGTVKLMDWNSVVNAGMGGQVFQDALKETARVHGIAIDSMIEEQGSFRETLQEGWLTSEILTETLQKFTLTTEGLTEAQIAENREMLKAKGYTDDQIDAIFELGKTSTDAATKVKTFTQLWNVLKEAAQSGWTQTWELIIGDFEGAKNLLTPLADLFTNIINKTSDARNKLIEGAMASPFGKLAEKIEKVTGATEKMSEVTKDYGEIVDKVIGGEYGNGQSRWDKLAKEGYDWAKVQNLVNEKLGDSTKHTEQLTDAQKKQSESQGTTIEQLVEMSDKQLKQLGFTKEEIKAFKELEEQSKKTGIPIKELIKDTDQLSGRNLLINSFKNAWSGLSTIIKAVSKAWRNAFPPMTSEQLYNIIAGIHKFSTYLVVGKDTAKKLTRTLKGLFAILDIIATITGGAFKIAFKVVTKLLSYFDTDILGVTASIGDAIVAFRDWLESVLDISKVLDLFIPRLKKVVNGIREWYKGLKDASPEEIAQAIVDGLKSVITSIPSVLGNLKTMIVSGFKEIPGDMISGFANGLSSKAKRILDIMIELGKAILEEIKGVLGIHSPSTEFFEIGKNIIQGLINGIQNGASAVWDVIKGIGSKCIDAIKSIDFGKVLAIVVAVGMFTTVRKLIQTLDKFAAPLEGLGNMFSGIGSMFESIGESFKANVWEKKSKAILNLAIAIGILAASVALLCQLDTAKLWISVGAIVVLAGVMAALSFAASKMGTIDFRNIGKQSIFLLALAGSLLILAAAMKKLTSIDGEDIPKVLGLLAGMVISMATLMFAFGTFAGGRKSANIDKAGIMLLKMAVALMIMTKVVEMASKLDDGAIVKGLGVIACLELLFAGIIAVSKYGGQNASKAGGMLLKMSIALIIMIGVIKLASQLSLKEIIKGITVVGAVMAFFSAVIAVSKFAGQNAGKAGVMMILMSVALLIMIGVIKLASQLDTKSIIKGLIVVSVLETLFAAIIAVSMFAGKNAVKAGMMLLLMSTALIILTGVLFILSQMDSKGLAKALGIVTVLDLLFGGLIAVTHLAEDCKATLIILIVAITLLIAAVVGLSFLDPQELAKITACLSALMSAFALMIAATNLAKNSKKMHITLLLMLGVVLVLAGIVAALAQLDAGSALQATMSLSMLMVSFAASMTLLGLAGKISKSVTKNMPILLAVVAGLAVILGVLTILEIEPSLKTVAALSILLLAMSASLVILGFVTPTATKGIIVLALLGLVVAELAVVLALITKLDINPSMETIKALSILLIAMSGALVILGIVGLMGPAAFIGVGALITLVTAIGGLLVAIGALTSKFPQLEEFLNTGIPILEKIGYALGSFFGNIVGGFSTALASSLPAIGTSLSLFMTNATPFINGAKAIDSTVIDGVSSLAKAIAALTAADFINTIASLMTFGSSFADLGTELSQFALNIVPFVMIMKTMDTSIFQSVESLANAILALTKADLLDGISSFLTGGVSFSDFGVQLVAFGTALVAFSKIVSENGGVNEEAVQAAANAGKIMTELQNGLVPTGGVVQWFTGEKNLEVFGTQLKAFGEALVDFSNTVSGEGAINPEAVEAAANAGNIMASMQKNIVGTGGVVEWFTGSKNMGTFGTQLKAFGEALAGFSATVSEKGAINQEAIQAAANAGTLMTTLQKSIPEDKWLDGKISLDDFGKKISSFGEKLVDYSAKVSEIDTVAITISLSSARALVSLINSMANMDISGVDNFKVKKIGSALKDYYSKIEDLDQSAIARSITSAKRLAEFINSLSGLKTDGVGNFKAALTSLGEANVDGVVTAFSDSASKLTSIGSSIIDSISKGMTSKKSLLTNNATSMINAVIKSINDKKVLFYVAGIETLSKFINGMLSQRDRAASTVSSAADNAASSARDSYQNFYNAGSYLVSGFVSGISENTFKAKAAANAMAKAAKEAAEKALDINSPSKVFYGIGDYAGQGFVNALVDYASVSYKAGSEMADSARSGLTKSISKIQNALNGNMNIQPTIRPVLDLSNVKSGADTISSMLALGSSIGVSANVGDISAMMSQNSQNGVGEDIVSAINKLRGDLGNVGNTTYQVNGVTYDDGSNVSGAIKDIIRFARVERRR